LRLTGPRIFLKINVFGHKTLGFVDCGSEISVIPLTCLQALVKENQWSKTEASLKLQMREMPDLEVVVQDGSTVKPLGVVVLPVEHDGVVRQVVAVVQDDESRPEKGYGLLLGTNALEDIGVTVLLKRTGEVIDMKNGGQFLDFETSDETAARASASKMPIQVRVDKVTVNHQHRSNCRSSGYKTQGYEDPLTNNAQNRRSASVVSSPSVRKAYGQNYQARNIRLKRTRDGKRYRQKNRSRESRLLSAGEAHSHNCVVEFRSSSHNKIPKDTKSFMHHDGRLLEMNKVEIGDGDGDQDEDADQMEVPTRGRVSATPRIVSHK
jgi:hypothetical protein